MHNLSLRHSSICHLYNKAFQFFWLIFKRNNMTWGIYIYKTLVRRHFVLHAFLWFRANVPLDQFAFCFLLRLFFCVCVAACRVLSFLPVGREISQVLVLLWCCSDAPWCFHLVLPPGGQELVLWSSSFGLYWVVMGPQASCFWIRFLASSWQGSCSLGVLWTGMSLSSGTRTQAVTGDNKLVGWVSLLVHGAIC